MHNWVINGVQIAFQVQEIYGSAFTLSPGVYIYAKYVLGKWEPVYIGESENLYDRIQKHGSEDNHYFLHGATHIHTREEFLEIYRTDLERALIGHFRPVANEQYT